MDRERWKRIEPILERALELPPERRAAWLDKACGDDAELRREVEALLASDDAATGHLLDGGLERFAEILGTEAETVAREPEPLPASIGSYRILSRLGEGGMGVVYRAEQAGPKRVVALKVVRAGMDSRTVIARFDAERQALARMSHPNVARVFDAGITSGGRPFFVMELVDGLPIHTYCDRHRLSTGRRLELFTAVCSAVQHAHRNGIIHRDLKPSNILVTEIDGAATPKVIDFGISKAIEPDVAAHTAFTEEGQFIGTPEYMSPEQAAIAPEGVDTRTDVYSLGVLLYELLTGTLPFDPVELRRAGFDAMRRMIRESEPARPSLRLRTLDRVRTDPIARARRVDPATLARRIEGELDWIVLRALEKDPERRYGSPAELAEDLRRHREHLPVQARPQSRLYRYRKFARRNRAAVAVAAALTIGTLVAAAALAFALVDSNRQRARVEAALTDAEESRDTAREVTDFLADLLSAARPDRMGRDVTVREVLADAAERIDDRLEERPLLESQARVTLGRTFQALGEPAAAEEQYRAVLELRREHLPERLDLQAAALNDLGVMRRNARRQEGAEEALREAIELSSAWAGPDDPSTLRYRVNLASVLEDGPDPDEAETLLRESIAGLRAALPPGHPDLTLAVSLLGSHYAKHGRFDEALPLIEETYAATRDQHGAEHPETLLELNNLAGVYAYAGRNDRAEEMFRELFTLRARVLGPEHPQTATAMSNLAELCLTNGKVDESVRLAGEATGIAERALPAGDWRTAYFRKTLGVSLAAAGRAEEAARELTAAHQNLSKTFRPDHPEMVALRAKLAEVLDGLGRAEEAARWREPR